LLYTLQFDHTPTNQPCRALRHSLPRLASRALVGHGWFILLTLGLLGLYSQFRETTAGHLGMTALVVMWIGVGLTLPYYGAETFALRAVGQEALRQNNVDLLVTITNSFRLGQASGSLGPAFSLLQSAPSSLRLRFGGRAS